MKSGFLVYLSDRYWRLILYSCGVLGSEAFKIFLLLKQRIRPGTTGFLFTRAKDSSVLRNTTEGLMRCWPNLNDMFSRLESERKSDLGPL